MPRVDVHDLTGGKVADIEADSRSRKSAVRARLDLRTIGQDCKGDRVRGTALLTHEDQRLLPFEDVRNHEAGSILEGAITVSRHDGKRLTCCAVQKDKHRLTWAESLAGERDKIVRLEGVVGELDRRIEIEHEEVRCDKRVALCADEEERVIADRAIRHMKLALADAAATIRLERSKGLTTQGVPIHVDGLHRSETIQ